MIVNREQYKVLVIDDELPIINSLIKSLSEEDYTNTALNKAEEELFGESSVKSVVPQSAHHNHYEVHSSQTGMQGLELVKEAISINEPYALLICDIRMAGWDGLKTVSEIRKVDPNIEVIFLSAYSDYTIQEIIEEAGRNISYLVKPFRKNELLQIVEKSIFEWQKTKDTEFLFKTITRLQQNAHKIEYFHQTLIQIVTEITNTSHAGLYIKSEIHGITLIQSTESWENTKISIPQEISQGNQKIFDSLEHTYLSFSEYFIVIQKCQPKHLSNKTLYNLEFVIEQAKQIENSIMLIREKKRNDMLKILGEAVSMISHDLRGPIGAIQTTYDILQDMEISKDPMVGKLLSIIPESCRSMNELIEDILDYTKSKTADMQHLRSGTLVRIVQNLLSHPLKDSNVEIVYDIDDCIILADEHKIPRVFYNIIKNAAEALSSKIKSPLIEVKLKVIEKTAHIEIRDNGPGIPEDLLPYLFDAFSTRNKISGTGLGLTIVKQILTAHKSDVDVKTSPEGTTFHFTLALAD